MAIQIAQKKEYPVLPEGTYDAALGAIIAWPNFPQKGKDREGNPVTRFKTRLVFAYVTEEKQPDGSPFDVLQLLWDSDISHPKSSLGPVLRKLAAGTPVKVEPGMDIEQFVGTQVKLMAEHNTENPNRTYVNVGSFQRNPKGTVQIPTNYVKNLTTRLESMRTALLAKAGVTTAPAASGAQSDDSTAF